MDKQEEGTKKNGGSWLPTIVSIVIGAILTIGVAYYQISNEEEEGEKAEIERYTKVKDKLVSLLEEKIVNSIVLDNSCLTRLIKNQTKLEKLSHQLRIADILSEAEYNILCSNHLDNAKKEECKNTLSKYYNNLQYIDSVTLSIDKTKYYNFKFESDINSFLDKLKNQENLHFLEQEFNKIITQYENEIIRLEENTKKSESSNIFSTLIEDPTNIIFVLTLYIIVLITINMMFKKQRKRSSLIKKRDNYLKEIEQINSYLSECTNEIDKKTLIERLDELKHRLHDINSILN